MHSDVVFPFSFLCYKTMAKPHPQIGSWTLPPLTPWARALIVVLVAIFLVQVFTRALLGFDTSEYAAWVEGPLALSAHGFFERGQVWQPLTYFWISPLHGIFSIVISAISVYFFGSAVEARLGGLRMLVAFISAGIAGGILTLAIAKIWLSSSNLYASQLMGTQASVSGLIATLCWLWRDRRLNLIIVQPLGWHLLVGYVVLTLLQGLLSHPYGVVPDFGGILMGMLIGANKGPYALYQRIRLWNLRRKIRSIRGGKDDRDWMN